MLKIATEMNIYCNSLFVEVPTLFIIVNSSLEFITMKNTIAVNKTIKEKKEVMFKNARHSVTFTINVIEGLYPAE